MTVGKGPYPAEGFSAFGAMEELYTAKIATTKGVPHPCS